MSKSKCSVDICTNYRYKCVREGRHLSWYNYPSKPWEKERRQIWIHFAKRVNVDGTAWTPTKHMRMCSEHFVGGKKSEDPRHPAYNPTIFDPKVGPKEDPKVLVDRYKRVLARWTRQREEAKAQEGASCRSPQIIDEEDASISPAPAVDIDSPPGSPLVDPPAPLESDITADKSAPIEGPKQLLCLICCQHCPPTQFKSYSNNVTFMRFCRYLYPSMPQGNSFLNTLKSYSSLSICAPCLSTVNSTTAQMNHVNHVSKIVTDLQKKLVEELKRLQSHVHQLKQEFQKMQGSVEGADQQLLEEYLTPPSINRQTPDIIKPQELVKFRQKIVRSANSLEEFREDLQSKVDCRVEVKLKGSETVQKDVTDVPSPASIQPDSPEQNLFEEAPLEPEEIPPPPSIPISRCLQKFAWVPRKRKLPPPSSTPRLLGKTFKKIYGRKVVLKHVWDGTQFKTIFPSIPPPPPPEPKPPVVKKPVTTVTCPACQKQFRSYSLRRHRLYSCPKSASPAEKLLCHLCSREFKQTFQLKQHLVDAHSEERPYLCSQCPRACASLKQLKSHEKTHSQERLVVCRKGCGGGFKNKSSRKRHEDLCNGKGTPFRKKAKQVAPPTCTDPGPPKPPGVPTEET